MILKTVHLKNFRKFKDTFIEFPDGVTGIIGLNGAGKSTIFEAIAWALYGPVAARTSADLIRREHAATTDPCRVSLEFIFNEDAYQITREMTGKSLTPQATAIVNNKILAQGADTVSRFIQTKLGMDFRSFFTSIFAKQKELNALSSMNPSDRRPLILKMLGIDALDTIVTDIRIDTREKKTYIEYLQNETYDTHGNPKITHLQQELQKIKEQQQTTIQIKQQLETSITTTTTQLNKIHKQTTQQKQHYEQLLKEKDTLETIKTQIDHRTQLQTQLKTLKQSFQQRTQQQHNLQKQLQKFNNITNELTTAEKQHQILTQQYEDLIKQTERLQTQTNQIDQEITKITTKKQNITHLGPNAHCPTCNRVLGTQHTTLINNYTKEINKHNTDLIILKNKYTEFETKKQQIIRQKEALTKKISFLNQQHLKSERLNTKIQSLTQEITREQNTIQDLTKDYTLLKKISFDPSQYQQLHTQIKKGYTAYQQLLTQQTVIQQKREKLRIKLETIKGQHKLKQQNIASIKEHIKEHRTLLKTLEKEQQHHQQLKILQEIMTGFRTHIISQIRPTLTQYASELFHQLTDGKYSAVELDDNYTLFIYDNGRTHPVTRFSGGEEDLANLCIRLAISEVIAERAGSIFQFIILDEIFGSQDAIRRQNIINTLNRFSTKFRQIFLITHIEEIKHYMEHTITVLENEAGLSSTKLE